MAVDEVKQQLDYTRRLEIFVADTEDQAVLFSYYRALGAGHCLYRRPDRRGVLWQL